MLCLNLTEVQLVTAKMWLDMCRENSFPASYFFVYMVHRGQSALTQTDSVHPQVW